MFRAMRSSRSALVAFVISAASIAGPACVVRADDIETKNDARLECYPGDKNVPMKDSGTATTWLGFAALGMLGLGGLFLNAKRSHLD